MLDKSLEVDTLGVMTYQQVEAFFGNKAAVRRALGVSRQTVYNWESKGIRVERQVMIEAATNGKLKADLPEVVRAA